MSKVKDYSYAISLYDKEIYDEAFKVFLGLAENEDYRSQYMLGNMLYYGLGAKKDEQKAYVWYERASNNGEAISQHLIGNCYLHGSYGFTKNFTKAFEYINKSSLEDYPNATHDLAIMYMQGIGIEADREYAKKLLEKNCKNKYLDSIKLLIEYYIKGYFGFLNRLNLVKIYLLSKKVYNLENSSFSGSHVARGSPYFTQNNQQTFIHR